MGKSAILLLAALPFIVAAQTRVPIDQFEQVLATMHHQADGASAAQLANFELVERVSPLRLSRWQSEFAGKQTRDVLLALADASLFQPLPAAEIPANPRPDQAAQAEILARARGYIRTMRPRLPNFSALRNTLEFETATVAQMLAEERMLQMQQLTHARLGFHSLGSVDSNGQDLFLLGSTTTLVTYRGGTEVQSPRLPSGKHRRLHPGGLTSAGEFGPILSLVDDDATHGKIVWDHWETGSAGNLAVFRYSVPKDSSDFAVTTSIGALSGLPANQEHPGYHGEIAIDPGDGTVFRIEIVSDAEMNEPSDAAELLVEYAPVVIGAKSDVCPVHAVALSTVWGSATDGPARTFLNDVTFTGYHVFRSESRIVPDVDR